MMNIFLMIDVYVFIFAITMLKSVTVWYWLSLIWDSDEDFKNLTKKIIKILVVVVLTTGISIVWIIVSDLLIPKIFSNLT